MAHERFPRDEFVKEGFKNLQGQIKDGHGIPSSAYIMVLLTVRV